MECYVMHDGKTTVFPFDENGNDQDAWAETLGKICKNGLALRIFDGAVAVEAEQFDAVRKLFQEKKYSLQDAENLQMLPANYSCIAVSTFMQILGDQLFEDARTITPFANISSKLQPAPPLISPARFASLLTEARRQTAVKKGFVVFASLLASEMDLRAREEKKKWAQLAQDEQKRLEDMAKQVAALAQPLLLYHDREGVMHVDQVLETGKIIAAKVANAIQPAPAAI